MSDEGIFGAEALLTTLAAALGVAWAGASLASPSVDALTRVAPPHLAVEAGDVERLSGDAFALRRPGVRAVVPNSSGSAARIVFTYLGPTRREEPLASGELRRQIGLKLRAHDTCNVVYAMWHVAPDTGIQVQVKANPGQRTHAECRDRGYRTLRPATASAVPKVEVGARHVLAARIVGRQLTVEADGVPAWQGELPDEAFAFDGPAGFRSDNGAFDAELWVERGSAGRASK
jgi:hypothetical protein